jgi:hypothetical protein
MPIQLLIDSQPDGYTQELEYNYHPGSTRLKAQLDSQTPRQTQASRIEQDRPRPQAAVRQQNTTVQAAATREGNPPPITGSTPGIGGDNSIVRVLEKGPGFNVVEYGNGRVERRAGARNWRNNNPGNIEFGNFARRHGAIDTDGRFAIFPTYEAGRRAKEFLLFESSSYNQLTIAQAISRYAPPSENNTQMYIRVVTSATGSTPDTPMSDLDASARQSLLAAMERVEGFRVGNIQVLQQERDNTPATADLPTPTLGPTLVSEGTQMTAADQARVRSGAQVIQGPAMPSSQPSNQPVSTLLPSRTQGGEVPLNRRLEQQVS